MAYAAAASANSAAARARDRTGAIVARRGTGEVGRARVQRAGGRKASAWAAAPRGENAKLGGR